jgi:amino acid/amide ABC transporter substrate-binding protein, HAAT family (TC 3.A.1.4.-)
MLVDKINAEGGISGKKIELIIADTEGDPAKAANIATKFIHKDKVVAIVGPTLTDTGMNVKKIVHDGKTPIVMTVGGDPVIMGGKFGPFDWVFKSPQRSKIAVERLFTYLKDKGLTKSRCFRPMTASARTACAGWKSWTRLSGSRCWSRNPSAPATRT